MRQGFCFKGSFRNCLSFDTLVSPATLLASVKIGGSLRLPRTQHVVLYLTYGYCSRFLAILKKIIILLRRIVLLLPRIILESA